MSSEATSQDEGGASGANPGSGGSSSSQAPTPEVAEISQGNSVATISPAIVYNKLGQVYDVQHETTKAVDDFAVPAGYRRVGTREASFMYSVGVYVEPISDNDKTKAPKYYCLANATCRAKKLTVPCKGGDRANVNKHLKKFHDMCGKSSVSTFYPCWSHTTLHVKLKFSYLLLLLALCLPNPAPLSVPCSDQIHTMKLDPKAVLPWWATTGKRRFPALAPVAQQVFGNQASAAQVERDFSGCGILLPPTRSRMDTYWVEMVMFVQANFEHIPGYGLIPMIAPKDIRSCLPARFTGANEDLVAAEAIFDLLSNTAAPTVHGMDLDEE